jgi:hypothetical protein
VEILLFPVQFVFGSNIVESGLFGGETVDVDPSYKCRTNILKLQKNKSMGETPLIQPETW